MILKSDDIEPLGERSRFLVAPEELPMRSSFCLVEKVLGVLPREFVANTESVGGDILYYATEYQPTCG